MGRRPVKHPKMKALSDMCYWNKILNLCYCSSQISQEKGDKRVPSGTSASTATTTNTTAKTANDTSPTPQPVKSKPRAFDIFNKRVAEDAQKQQQQQQELSKKEATKKERKIVGPKETNNADLSVGKMKYVPPKAEITHTSEMMWSKLQRRKGDVTVRDILDLCEKARKPKIIRVPGWDGDDTKFQGYQNIDEMLDSFGVETSKVGQFLFIFILLLQWSPLICSFAFCGQLNAVKPSNKQFIRTNVVIMII